MTTTLELLGRARRLAVGPRRDHTTTVDTTAVTASATTVRVASTTGFAAQTVIEVGSEQMYVTAVSSPNLTVVRGYNNTAPTAHAVGSFVIANPTVTMAELLDATNAELNSLSSTENGLYRVWHTDISSNSGKLGFDLDPIDGFIDVLKVQYRETASLRYWKDVHGWSVQRDAYLTDFASGIAITFRTGLPGTFLTRVWYAAAFGQLTGGATEDVEATTGIPPTAIDILPMGAAIRAVEAREIHRTPLTAAGDARRLAEVPMGNALQSTSVLRRSRNERIAEEAARLKTMWGR